MSQLKKLTPVVTETPQSAEDLAEIVRAASERRIALVPWGAGTLQYLAGSPQPEAQPLPTSGLSRVLEYNPADLTVTAESGVALGTIQALLRPHGQWLPWDPPAPAQASLGGLLAAGVSGPLRLGYGTPRDWVLGMRVVLGDGRLVKSGGKVVKNVAGYDAHKLHIGAFGTLGVIAEATLKVAPLPEQTSSLAFGCRSAAEGFALAEQLRARPLAPVSLVVANGLAEPWALAQTLVAVRFAGVADAVARQLDMAALAARQLPGATLLDLGGGQHQQLWQALEDFAAPGLPSGDTSSTAMIVRAGAPVAMLPTLTSTLARNLPAQAQLVAQAGVGLAHARWEPSGAGDAFGVVAGLRADLAAIGGYVVVEHVPPSLADQVDRWGPAANLPIMRALKAEWDPRGILNRGRYVGGI